MKFKNIIFLILVSCFFFACDLDPDFTPTTGGGGTAPTCVDGIQNGNETGVDCGGDCVDCANVLKVDFTVVNDSCSVSCEIEFINNSIGYDTYFWDFGDQSNSTLENPKHVYSNTGSYIVKLIATNSDGSNETNKSVFISIPTFYKVYGSSDDDTRFKDGIEDKQSFIVITGSQNDELLLNKVDNFQGSEFWGSPRIIGETSRGNAILQNNDNNYVIGGFGQKNGQSEGKIYLMDEDGFDTGLAQTQFEFDFIGEINDIKLINNQYHYLGTNDLCFPSQCNHCSHGILNEQFSLVSDQNEDGFGNITVGRSFDNNGLRQLAVGDQDGDIYYNIMEYNGVSNVSGIKALEGIQKGNSIVGNPTNNIFSIGGRTDANNNNDFLFMQLDANFNVISNKTIGGLGSEECNAIIAYNDGYLMAGNSNSFSSDLDLFLVYVDQDGDVVWQRVFQNEGDDFAEDIILLSDGGIAILGNKITNSKSQGVLLKLDPLGFIR